MAWIESPTVCINLSRVASLWFLFFFFFFFICVPAVDRSIDPRLIALREPSGDTGSSLTSVIGVNVERTTHVRKTCCAVVRTPLRFDWQETRERLGRACFLIYCRFRDRGEALRGRLWSVFATPRHALPLGNENFLSSDLLILKTSCVIRPTFCWVITL